MNERLDCNKDRLNPLDVFETYQALQHEFFHSPTAQAAYIAGVCIDNGIPVEYFETIILGLCYLSVEESEKNDISQTFEIAKEFEGLPQEEVRRILKSYTTFFPGKGLYQNNEKLLERERIYRSYADSIVEKFRKDSNPT